MDTASDVLEKLRVSPTFVSDNDIVPEEFQNQLIYWRDKLKDGYFGIGDLANTLAIRAAREGFPIGQMRVYEAVGTYCGKSARTIRYYAETASFFELSTRQEYEHLPFSHFVFARTMGERWEEVLEYASERPYLSRASLEDHFLGNPDKFREISQSISSTDLDEMGIVSIGDPLRYDEKREYSHVKTMDEREHALRRMDDFSASMRDFVELVDGINVEKHVKDDIAHGIYLIKKHLPKLVNAVV
jgi:hypothetical protein